VTPTWEQVEAGQAVYSKLTLAIYDWFVLGFSNRFIWRCQFEHILALYNRHVTANHLDVGVGTGYFLDRCRFPHDRPRLGLVDLNQNCLDVASRRLTRYRPTVYRTDALAPIVLDIPRVDSISVTYVLHCLPGTIKTKGALLRNLTPFLNRGGTLFGATLLTGGVDRSRAAQRLMAFYNSRGIFTNDHDDLLGLKNMLSEHLTAVHIDVVGCAALFSGRV